MFLLPSQVKAGLVREDGYSFPEAKSWIQPSQASRNQLQFCWKKQGNKDDTASSSLLLQSCLNPRIYFIKCHQIKEPLSVKSVIYRSISIGSLIAYNLAILWLLFHEIYRFSFSHYYQILCIYGAMHVLSCNMYYKPFAFTDHLNKLLQPFFSSKHSLYFLVTC